MNPDDVKRLITYRRIRQEIVEGIRVSHYASNGNDREIPSPQAAACLKGGPVFSLRDLQDSALRGCGIYTQMGR